MTTNKVHNIRFYKPQPNAIYCMALHKTAKKLALSRSDATVEIWDLNNIIFLEKTIVPDVENFSIEGICWHKDRLFSVGLHGFLVEYDLKKLNVLNKVTVTGQAAHCLDINDKGEIAVGTEQGYLNIFEAKDDEVNFKKFLDKQEGRFICLKYHPDGDFIVSGSIDVLRIWDVKTGHALHKLSTGRSETKKETIVWCLEVTKDFTIISGDSRGKLTFWDGKIGSQIESYQSHRADILSLCLSSDEKSLFCAGVDPNICNYIKISVKGESKYVKSIHRKIHDHDVRAMIICNNKLYTGGVDGYLACSYHPPKTLLKFPTFEQNACSVANGKFLCLQYSKYLELWTLGKPQKKDDSDTYNLAEEPKKLVVLQRLVKDYEEKECGERIICSALSNDAKWIMFSTQSGIFVYLINYDGASNISLAKVANLENKDVACLQALFTPDSGTLIVAPITGGLRIYELDATSGNASVGQNIISDEVLNDCVSLMRISNCGKYLVVSDTASNIGIWQIKQKKMNFYCKLPKYQVPVTTLGIHPKLLNLVVVYSDGKMIEYDISKRKITDFSRKFQEIITKLYPIKNVAFDPKLENIIVLHDDHSLIVINKDKMQEEIDKKVAKIDINHKSADKEVNNSKGAISLIKKYKHLVYFNWIKEDEMIAVEVNPMHLLEQLPPAFVTNTFGKK